MIDAVVLRQKLDLLGVENLRRQSGARDDLLATAAQLEVSARRLGVADLIAVSLTRRSDIQMALGHYDDALATLSDARIALGALRESDLLVSILYKQAEAQSRLGNWSRVSTLCGEGIDVVEKYRYKVTAQYQQAAYLRFRIGLYTLGVRAACELGIQNLALERAELAKCRSVLMYKHRSPTDRLSTTEIEKEFRDVSAKINDIERAQREIPESLLVRRRMLWDRLCIQRYQAGEGERSARFKIEIVQSALEPDEAVIYYFWMDSLTLLISVIDSKDFMVEKRELSVEERDSLDNYARSVMRATGDPAELQPVLQLVRTFGSALLPREAQKLMEGKRRLLLSPHRQLHAIPFHALPWNGEYLIQHFAVSYVPNLSSFALQFTPPSRQNVLALGVTDYAVPGETLARLEAAEPEVCDLENIYAAKSIPITALTSDRVTEDNIGVMAADGRLGNYSCLHFATHGETVESDTPMESHLFLRNSKLEAIEIANWQLNAEIVVLSACCSGQRSIWGRGMPDLPGDDLLGLQAAFFTAGARNVLCSLWPVGDDVARQIMTGVHGYLAEGLTAELALQAAINRYLQNAGMQTRKVYYWAPFFLATVGRPLRAA